jgi:hypothetical protein
MSSEVVLEALELVIDGVRILSEAGREESVENDECDGAR